MQEAQGDLFSGGRDWLVFTANSMVTRDRRLVMGAGVARQFRDRYPGIDLFFGAVLLENGLVKGRFHLMADLERQVLALQTKIDWREPSPLELVVESCNYLGHYAHVHPAETFGLCRPGCGLGELDWNLVRPRIAPLLPGNVTIYSL